MDHTQFVRDSNDKLNLNRSDKYLSSQKNDSTYDLLYENNEIINKLPEWVFIEIKRKIFSVFLMSI
jgi:hypothetical protein